MTTEIMRPEDHVDAHGALKMMPEAEPIDHGFVVWFRCECGDMFEASIDFDEMEIAY